jgi:hypothetical protein
MIAGDTQKNDRKSLSAAATLSTDDLRPADILLSSDDSAVSRAIVAADGGGYSHAALWSGSAVIEATSQGINEIELRGPRAVFRHRAMSVDTAASIVVEARSQLGARYAYSELLLLGLLFTLRLRPQAPILDSLIEALGGPGAEKLKAWLDRDCPGKTPRICTELVAHCYFRAGTDAALRIARRPVRSTAQAPRDAADRDTAATVANIVYSAPLISSGSTDPSVLAFERTRESCRSHLVRHGVIESSGLDTSAQAAKLFAGKIAWDADTGAPVGVVTPADIEFSPSLRFLGCVHGPVREQAIP